MQDLKALNTREKKDIYKKLKEQFGHDEKFDQIVLLNPKEKIYLLSKGYADLDVKGMRINNKALYFGKLEKDGLRLSIEGSQLIKANKNVIELNKEELHQWMKGEDIAKEGSPGYVIVKHKKDIFGCGMHKNNVLRNMVPKERRLHSVTE
tara:strand:+ start:12363 stop:12812 length:450 start_codon:yes stop_codon:yes gene_type:complete